MKSLNNKWLVVLIALLGGFSFVQSQNTELLENFEPSGNKLETTLDYAQVIIMVSTNNGENPDRAFVELNNL